MSAAIPAGLVSATPSALAADLTPLLQFLPCATPGAWLDWAAGNLELLLIDHANCEKKAAATALHLIHRYPEHHKLLGKLSRLAREELRHFEQVIAIMHRRGIPYRKISASRYASGLRTEARAAEPGRLADALIIGALIEARSCERFAALAPRLDGDGHGELAAFYRTLLQSEARHFQDYLALARQLAGEGEVEQRLAVFKPLEAGLIQSPDKKLRFHSGVPEKQA